MIRRAKGELRKKAGGEEGVFRISCEAMPHHIALTEGRARELGEESFGRVNPPLRAEADRRAILEALLDGTIDAIATDHAPHSMEDKAGGAPGFSGLETAFAVCYTELVGNGAGGRMDLGRLSSLMSAGPARLLGLAGGCAGRGLIAPGLRADLVIIDPEAVRKVDPASFKSRGKNTPFAGRELFGRVLMTIQSGRVVFEA
jgi:dihydroorotase